jgi:photosystem II stability/assembly factor-like uncharacterized protein
VELTSVAAHGHSVWIGANGDIAVSRDGGATWGLSQLPVKAEVMALAASPDYPNDGLVLAATARDGVLRSTDGGATFHAWNFGLLDLNINALAISPAFARDGHVLAASDHAVFLSRNGGRAWRELDLPGSGGPYVAVAFGPAGSLLVGSESAGLWQADTIDAAFARDSSFAPETVNALLGEIAATSSGIFRRARASWKRISPDDRALCLQRCGDVLFTGGLEAGVSANTI